ncbi:MAG: hypothetical protein AB8B80_13915 [Marinicellaceae bacterium]
MFRFNFLRRAIGQKLDQFFAVLNKRFNSSDCKNFDGEATFALVTVNFSTTYYLKLMLLTLCEQNNLDKISQIIVVDNHSKDGGTIFLKQLSQSVKKVECVNNYFFKTHARGVRIGIEHLNQLSSKNASNANILMVCDTDIIFRNKDTLNKISEIFESSDAAFVGELRYSNTVCPQAQASFLCVRRDIYSRIDIKPFVNHGSPAYWMQKSLWKAGLKLHDFKSNHGGFILHRGRSGVAAAKKHHPMSSFAQVENNQAHYMGVENGDQIWQAAEKKYSELLKKENEKSLIDYLSQKLVN